MLKSQFDFLCETFGDPKLDKKDRWKSVKYIFNENPLGDMQLLINRNEAVYIDDVDMGAGFVILSTPIAELNPISKEKTITFIPLSQIDKISFVTDNIEVDDTEDPSETSITNIGTSDKAVVNKPEDKNIKDYTKITAISKGEVNGIIISVG